MSSAADIRALSVELRLDAQNPWPGLTAFTEKQHEFFYGREQESHELFSCVKRERLTVLFGKSGLGKTSLLQAGLFPQLRAADYLPVYVRLSYEDNAAAFDTQLRTALESAIELANFAEVAVPQAGESVWEYLHRRGGNLINDDGNVVMPVLIFDQFEECFTLGARKEFSSRLCNEFLPGLAEMIENRTPAALTKKLTDDRDLAKRYDLEAPGCRILITLREDYLANLEALRDSMPSLVYIDNRMRLTEMTGEQALSVVVDPSPDLVAADVAESIVRFVAGAHTDSADGAVRTVDALPLRQLEVAPAILSLFCSQLNQERLKTPGMSKITRELVLSQGVTIIEDFYKKCIADMHPSVRRLIEDRLLTTAGYRDNIDLAEARACLERAGASPSAIDELVRLRLLQIEDHRGVPRLELTHDVLAEPVKHSRDDWKKEQQHEAAQQQERDALLRAKEAEQEALKRTRFLQRMVAAAAFVCVLLAGVVVYGVVERNHAKSNAARAEQFSKTAESKAIQAQQEADVANKNLAEAKLAEEKAKVAEQNAKMAEQNTLRAQASETKALKNALDSNGKAVAMQSRLASISGRALNFCVAIHQAFDTAAENEKDDAGKDAVRTLYGSLLMDNGQCLDLAKAAYEQTPNDVDVTDSLAMIPVQAAASIADLHANSQAKIDRVKLYFQTDLNLPMFQAGDNGDARQIELAGVYLAFAYLFSYLHDDSARSTADRGLNILNSLGAKAQSESNGWDYHVWDVYAEANAWKGYYLQDSGKKADAVASFAESFNDEKRAAALAPKEKTYYVNEALSRATKVADTQKDLGTNDEAAIGWYQQALAIAQQVKNQARITDLYTTLRGILIKDREYDHAQKLMDERIQSLEGTPEDAQRDQDLAQAYRDAAEVQEANKRYVAGTAYRARVVQISAAMKPNLYADEKTDLIFAYSLLSWDEIFSGQVNKGLEDTRTAISLSKQTEGQPGLDAVYENGIRALTRNGKYEEAEKLMDEFTQTLSAGPYVTDREREIATVVDVSKAQIEEAKKQWSQAAAYRRDAVKRLAALDPKAYDSLKADLVSAYGSLAFESEEAGMFADGVEAAKAGLKLDPSQSWIEENEANGLLLSGHPGEAKDLYMKVKDVQWQGDPMTKAISDDLTEFCHLGYARPEMTGIAHDLGIKNDELYSCLAAPPQPGQSK
jgi:hypothetical protein